MRTPSWEQSPGALAALLNSGVPLERADCYTITLPSGQVLRWSGSDVAITFGGNVYALGPGITRNRLRWVVGVEVSTLDMTLTDIAGTQIAGRGLLAFIRSRGFYGARVLLQRAFWAFGDTGPRGAVLWFAGAVADCKVDRDMAQLTVNSDIERLNVQVPRDVYQPGCLNSLYDGLCQVSRAAFTVTGVATSASNGVRTTFGHVLSQAGGWFDLGVVTMTSGANAGQSRTVKHHNLFQLVVLQPWGFPVASGDTFSIVAGCNKTQATCASKFSNLARFRGMPYIPQAETIT